MKKIGLFLLLFCCSLLTVQAGKVVTDSIKSEVLGTYVKYNVYLPDGFEKTQQHYAMIYLLHGLYDNCDAWPNKGNVQEVADELMETGECRKSVIVMPNAGDVDVHNVPNGYFNMEGWAYEDFFFKELLPQLEKKYRAGGKKELRAIMGLSMGGGGSVAYTQKHPGVFSSCYAMSPWLDNKANNVNQGDKIDWLYRTGQSVTDNSTLEFIKNADEKTLRQMRSTRWIVDCGDDDFLFDLAVEFHKLMREKKVKSELRIRNGVHNWEYWHTALREALKFANDGFSIGYQQRHDEFANYARYAKANAELGEPKAGEKRVVLMGNSITDFWPTRYAHTFEGRPWLIGRGISGQTSYQFLLRFRQDVIDLKPTTVVINYGTNDVAENTGRYNEDWTFGNVCSMVDMARANGIKVILASCLPAGGFGWRPEITDAMAKIKSLNARVKAYAKANNIPYIDYFSKMVSKDGKEMNPELAVDYPAIHPNAKGYAIMEKELLKALK